MAGRIARNKARAAARRMAKVGARERRRLRRPTADPIVIDSIEGEDLLGSLKERGLIPTGSEFIQRLRRRRRK